MAEILDVDLIAFEKGDSSTRAAVVDGVMRSLDTGFVYTSHDMGEDMLDEAYGMLTEFFSLPAEEKQKSYLPGVHGQTGYTGLLVETAASSDVADWKEMLNWGRNIPDGHPLKRNYPTRYPTQVLPEAEVPGIAAVLNNFHDKLLDLQRRFLRIIALGIGCHESFFDEMTTDGTTLTRAIHYPAMDLAPGAGHEWAAAHGDINLITALPRATKKGLMVQTSEGWVDAIPPAGQAIINTGIMLEHLTNGRISQGVHKVVADPENPGERYSVVQFCHPTPWTMLTPVASCVNEGMPQRFAGVSAGDRLDQVIYEINLVEDARRLES